MGKSNLYLYSLEEARRRGELPLWQASQRTNIACRDALSGAVKACDDSGVSGTDCISLAANGLHGFWPIRSNT